MFSGNQLFIPKLVFLISKNLRTQELFNMFSNANTATVTILNLFIQLRVLKLFITSFIINLRKTDVNTTYRKRDKIKTGLEIFFASFL